MKKLVLVLSVFVFLFSSCAEEIGNGKLIKKVPYEELNKTEKKNSEMLFGEDCYWFVKTGNDTIRGILPDYIEKKTGDEVRILLEGDEGDFITLK